MPSVPVPGLDQWTLWFKLNNDDFGIVCHGIQECCKLYIRRCGVLEFDHALKHSSKVMNVLRRDRARLKKPVEHFPMNVLTKNLADELGLPAGMALTKEAFWRCHARLQAIQAGRVKRPNAATETNNVSPN